MLKIPRSSLDPITVFKRLKTHGTPTFILESVQNGENGRYTFLGFNPTKVWTLNNSEAYSEIVQEMLDFMSTKKRPTNPDFPPFTGGLVGYFSYDFIKYQEPTLKARLERPKNDDEQFNDMDLMYFGNVVVFDHEADTVWIFSDDDEFDNEILELIQYGEVAQMPALKLESELSESFNRGEFENMLQKAKAHIKEGDIFQVVVSNKVTANASGSIFETYLDMRVRNPSPYMFYFSSEDLEIAGSSPETLVSLDKNRVLNTFPLAGSRPRGTTDLEDAKLEEELLNDEKERSEHNMLVDLGRNDIGKISKYGSVQVEDYMSVQKYSHIQHIASKVVGELRDGLTPFDAIGAVLPAGTLSGAPKIRAAEIIDELEGDKRGIYGGCLGYISNTGEVDMCITIRSAYKTGGKVFARAGAGIVHDSVPHKEYEEVQNKLASVIQALKGTPSDIGGVK